MILSISKNSVEKQAIIPLGHLRTNLKMIEFRLCIIKNYSLSTIYGDNLLLTVTFQSSWKYPERSSNVFLSFSEPLSLLKKMKKSFKHLHGES